MLRYQPDGTGINRTEEEEGERDREMDQINDKIMINDIKINNVLE